MRNKKDWPEVEPVKLEAINGIRPGIIILVVLIAIILLLFFLLCALPGIIGGGKYVSFTSPLTEVGVYLDDKYLGSSTGSRYFIEGGEHKVRYVKDGLTIYEGTIKIAKPIFFTLFHHQAEDIEIEFATSKELEERIDEEFLKGIAEWSKVTSFDSVTSLPPLFSNYAKDLVALNKSLDSVLWRKAEAHISSVEMYEDYISSCTILGIESNIDRDIFSSDDSAKYSSNHIRIQPEKRDGFYFYPETTFLMGSYQGNNYPLINEKQVEVTVSPFLISERPVSEYEYALFVESNPYWSIDNKENLVRSGLVDENYLNGISLSTSYESTRPIRNISYYAALAYTSWLSEKTGESYSLPSEAEWTLACYSAEGKRFASSLVHRDLDDSTPSMMLGGVWEMTKTEYVPLMRLDGYNESLSLPLDDIIVKGGSYINVNDGVTSDTVGIMAKNTSSDYAGFRIVKHE